MEKLFFIATNAYGYVVVANINLKNIIKMNDFQMDEEGREEAEAKHCNIAIVSGRFYFVKLMSDDKHEPAIAINLLGVMNFQFFNGVAVPCDKVNDYSECNYR